MTTTTCQPWCIEHSDESGACTGEQITMWLSHDPTKGVTGLVLDSPSISATIPMQRGVPCSHTV